MLDKVYIPCSILLGFFTQIDTYLVIWVLLKASLTFCTKCSNWSAVGLLSEIELLTLWVERLGLFWGPKVPLWHLAEVL